MKEFLPGHTAACIETLDDLDRCTACLKRHGREPNDPWREEDNYYVPPIKQAQWKTRRVQ